MRCEGFVKIVIALALSFALMACGEDAEIDLDDPGPLAGFPTCEPAPSPARADVKGLTLPDEAVVTSVRRRGLRLRNVAAYIELTPIEFRQFYERQKRLEFFLIEDEVVEAEIFFSDGRHRNFVKARAICERGSKILAIVAPENYKDLPIPKTSMSPTP